MEMAKAAHVNSAYVAPQISAENMEMIPHFHFPRLLVALLPHVHPQFCITSVHGHTHKGQLASMHHPTGTELDGFSSWNSAAVDVGVGAEAVRLCCRTCGTDCMNQVGAEHHLSDAVVYSSTPQIEQKPYRRTRAHGDEPETTDAVVFRAAVTSGEVGR
uniref:Uncharacterized protein n=1 Tax=Oryza nivara TaxID=4536 RepID=A0A679BA82_ORYNI|nr:hypothetical protein [Oryza sativa f. spontanea]